MDDNIQSALDWSLQYGHRRVFMMGSDQKANLSCSKEVTNLLALIDQAHPAEWSAPVATFLKRDTSDDKDGNKGNKQKKSDFVRAVLGRFPHITPHLFRLMLHSLDTVRDDELFREMADLMGEQFVSDPDGVITLLESTLCTKATDLIGLWRQDRHDTDSKFTKDSVFRCLRCELHFTVKFFIVCILLCSRNRQLMGKLKSYFRRNYERPLRLIIRLSSTAQNRRYTRHHVLLNGWTVRVLTSLIMAVHKALEDAGKNQWKQAISSNSERNDKFFESPENDGQRELLSEYYKFMVAMHNESWNELSLDNKSDFVNESLSLMLNGRRSVVGFVATICLSVVVNQDARPSVVKHLLLALHEKSNGKALKLPSARFHRDLLLTQLVYLSPRPAPELVDEVIEVSRSMLRDNPSEASGHAFANLLARVNDGSADGTEYAKKLKSMLEECRLYHMDSISETTDYFVSVLVKCCYHPDPSVGDWMVKHVVENWLPNVNNDADWTAHAVKILSAFKLRHESRFAALHLEKTVNVDVLESVTEPIAASRDIMKERYDAVYQWGWNELLATQMGKKTPARYLLVRNLLGGLVTATSVNEFAMEFRRLVLEGCKTLWLRRDQDKLDLTLNEAEARCAAKRNILESKAKQAPSSALNPGPEDRPRSDTASSTDDGPPPPEARAATGIRPAIFDPDSGTEGEQTRFRPWLPYRPACSAFDRLYLKRTDPLECKFHRNPDTFDGKQYTIEGFHQAHKVYFEEPSKFYHDFKDQRAFELRDTQKPSERAQPSHRGRLMGFESPITTAYSSTNRVPLKWFGDPDRPARTIVLFVPGWGRRGQWIEEQFCTRLLKLGIDSALLTVPYHLDRAPESALSGEYFISANVLWTVENFRHMVAEIRQLIQFFRSHYSFIGLLGQSSGGFQACLASTVEEIDFLFPYITGCHLADITWEGALTTRVVAQLKQKGISREQLSKVWEIADCATLGRHCKARHVKHYIGEYDTVVPPKYQHSLWEALGKRGDRLSLPCGHHSSFLLNSDIAKNIAAFISTREPEGLLR